MSRTILLISNNPISRDSNNGVTIANFLSLSKPFDIINLYFSNSLPSVMLAKSYFRITDLDVLKFGCFKRIGDEISKHEPASNNRNIKKKTAFKQLIRTLLWQLSNWNNKKLKTWIKSYNPCCIILQIGDAVFVNKIANKLSLSLNNIPIFIYNSENYFFKNFDFYKKKTRMTVFYSIYYKILVKSYKQLKNVKAWFHLSESLQNKYSVAFPHAKHLIARNTPFFKPIIYRPIKGRFNVYYFGNLGLGRLDSLLEFADILHHSIPTATISVFGELDSENQKKLINKKIIYNGFVKIDKIKEEINERCDLLLHIESFDDYSTVDLIDAFSTKIVDCLNSGLPFLVYMPSTLNVFAYLKNNKVCHTASQKNELEKILKMLDSDTIFRTKYIKNAQKLINNNHNQIENSKLIENEIISCLKEK